MKKKELAQTNGDVTISYRGNVSIKGIDIKTGQVTKRIQKHNTGKVAFFELIAQSIAGNNVTSLMPRYLRGFNGNESTISSFIPYNSPILSKTETNASVSFEFLIPYTQLSTTLYTTKLCLYNSTTSSATVFADIELGDDKKFKSDGNTNYLVTWTIVIGNA